MIVTLPIGSCAVKVLHASIPGTWEFGVVFRRGRGRLFNAYTRYYLRQYGERCTANLWEGNPANGPDPMDPSERRRVYDWIEQDTRARAWLERKITTMGRVARTLEPYGQE